MVCNRRKAIKALLLGKLLIVSQPITHALVDDRDQAGNSDLLAGVGAWRLTQAARPR